MLCFGNKLTLIIPVDIWKSEVRFLAFSEYPNFPGAK